jgi:dihydrofolate reductase
MPAATSRKLQTETEAQPAASPRKVVLGVAVSLDGYIARHDGAVDWITMDPELDLGAYAKAFDVIVAGRKTMPPPKTSGKAKGGMGMGNFDRYVFSRTVPPGRHGGAEYVNQPPSELIHKLKSRPGKDIWLFGGGELARDFLKEDLIDRMDLGIMPVLLGEGIPLFPHGFPQRDFTLVKFQAYKSGVVMASYVRASAKPRGKR